MHTAPVRSAERRSKAAVFNTCFVGCWLQLLWVAADLYRRCVPLELDNRCETGGLLGELPCLDAHVVA